jgi:hypothetical protein
MLYSATYFMGNGKSSSRASKARRPMKFPKKEAYQPQPAKKATKPTYQPK